MRTFGKKSSRAQTGKNLSQAKRHVSNQARLDVGIKENGEEGEIMKPLADGKHVGQEIPKFHPRHDLFYLKYTTYVGSRGIHTWVSSLCWYNHVIFCRGDIVEFLRRQLGTKVDDKESISSEEASFHFLLHHRRICREVILNVKPISQVDGSAGTFLFQGKESNSPQRYSLDILPLEALRSYTFQLLPRVLSISLFTTVV